MDLRAWNVRYRAEAAAHRQAEPVPLLIHAAKFFAQPGRALDLACGTGRHALWLAQQGWSVTAVDGAPAAIDALRQHATQHGLNLDAHLADLEQHQYTIAPESWDLIVSAHYFQRDLLETAKRGLLPGGILLVIALLAEPGRAPSPYRLQPAELRNLFTGFEILHSHEGLTAEILVRRPQSSPATAI